jgi:FlaA1/EpsC-like NDP-sugar epimerase
MQAYHPYIAACAGVAFLWLFRSSSLSQKELKKRLTDRVVIVTGAARGLGRAVANEFGKAGAK